MPNDMGIGAPVKRVEDKRFVTGKGRYTDDFNQPGQHYAAFVRSPYAHAKINGVDKSAALAAPGVVAVYDGADLTGDGIGNLFCGWAVTSKDGTPMKMGAWSALATSHARYVGDAVAVVIADTLQGARDAAEQVAVDYEELPAVTTTAAALAPGAPQIHPEAEGNLIYDWELGDQAATDAAISSAAKVVEVKLSNNRLIPNAMEPRACLAKYDEMDEQLTLWTTSQNPHVVRLVMSAFFQIAPEHKLRVIAPDVGGGFGSKIYIYPEETTCIWASRKAGVPVKWTADRSESFITDAHARDHKTVAKMAFDAEQQDHRAEGLDRGEFRGVHVALFVVGADVSLCDAVVGPVRDPEHLCRGEGRLHQHRSGRRLSRRGPARGVLCRRAADGEGGARTGCRQGGSAAQQLHPRVPVRDAGHHDL